MRMNYRMSRRRARIEDEVHSSPEVGPLKRLPDLFRHMVTKDSAAQVNEQRPGERKAQQRAPARVVSAIARFCRPSPLLLANGAPATIRSTSQLVRCDSDC